MFGISSGINLLIFIKSTGVGFLLAVFYGILILLRRAGVRNKYIVFVQDLVFSLTAALVSFMFVYHMNAGVPRAYIFLGEAFGFLLFFLYKIPVRW